MYFHLIVFYCNLHSFSNDMWVCLTMGVAMYVYLVHVYVFFLSVKGLHDSPDFVTHKSTYIYIIQLLWLSWCYMRRSKRCMGWILSLGRGKGQKKLDIHYSFLLLVSKLLFLFILNNCIISLFNCNLCVVYAYLIVAKVKLCS